MRIGRTVAMTVATGALGAAAGCGSPAAVGGSGARPSVPDAYATPLQATLAWFRAVNAKDLPAAQAHFEPSHRDLMYWGAGVTSTWSTFSDLHCRPLHQANGDAVVYCSFDESASPSEGNPDNFWTVSLHREPDARWLIDNYGQG